MATLADHWRCNETGTLSGENAFANEADGTRNGTQTGGTFTGGNASIGNLGTAVSHVSQSSRMFVSPAVNYNQVNDQFFGFNRDELTEWREVHRP